MPTVDLSSYHQPPGTVGDGTKFDNLIDAIQAALNGLDNNNIAVAAGIVVSKLSGPYTAYVPVWAASGTAVALNNGTITGSYLQIGKLVQGSIVLTMGAGTTYGTGTYTLTLPVPATGGGGSPLGAVTIYDSSASAYYTHTALINSSTTILLMSNAAPGVIAGQLVPVTFAPGDQIIVNFSYQAA